MKLCEYVTAMRKARGMSLTGLAKKSGLSRGYIHLIENGQQSNPTISVLIAITKGLNVSLVQLVSTVHFTVDGNEPLPYDPLPFDETEL